MTAWTYGAELEWPDVDATAELPEGWAWSKTDYTIVNSDGVANDPLRKLVLRGGELNTPACETPAILAARVHDVRELLSPGHNYRSNLHVHVHPGDDLNDIAALRQVAGWMRDMVPRMLPYADPLDRLLQGLNEPEEIAAAEKRMKHSERSRHYFISPGMHKQRMQAETVEEFLAASVPRSHAGKPLWHMISREAVNFLSLRKHGTVEFRCFAADMNAENVLAAATFAQSVLLGALHGLEMFEIPFFTDLPKQVPFSKTLEDGWAWTNFRHNKRAVVEERLRALGRLPERACSP